MKKIKVGIIGYGLSGRYFHAPILRKIPEFEVTEIFSSSKQKEIHLDFPGVTIAKSVDQLMKSDVDLVVITSPNTEHYSQTKFALNCGKHVVCEKPFVAKLDQAVELIELAEKNKKVLSVFHNRRWDSDFLEMKKVIRDNRLGDWTFFESRFDRFRPILPPPDQRRWRDQPQAMSGVFWDLGPHLIDQALCLFGFPKSVQLQLLFQRNGVAVDDGFILNLGYSHKTALLRASSVCAFSDLRMQLDCLKGGVQILGLDLPEGQVMKVSDGETRTETTLPIADYSAFYQGIRDSILTGSDAPVTGQEATDVLQIMDLAIRSHHLGQRMSLRGH